MDTLSLDTQKLIKKMMHSHKLTKSQQKELDACFLENKQPIATIKPIQSLKPKYKIDGKVKRQLRSFETIVKSGAYETEDFVPVQTKSYECEKEKLQGKEIVVKVVAKPVLDTEEDIDEFNTIYSEIAERKQFLEDMEEIGKDADYRQRIHVEIAQRVVLLKKLHSSSINE